MIDWKFDFELRHMFYGYLVAITWLGLTFWGDRLLDRIYFDLVPQIANTFTIVSYVFGFLVLAFSIFVTVEAFEILN